MNHVRVTLCLNACAPIIAVATPVDSGDRPYRWVEVCDGLSLFANDPVAFHTLARTLTTAAEMLAEDIAAAQPADVTQ